MASRATMLPGRVIRARADALPRMRDPSSSCAVIRTGPAGTTAASTVACISTRRLAVSTSAGRENTSDRKTSGTTRRVHVPVDAARLQIVDGGGAARRAVGRHIQPPGVHDDRQYVVTIDQVPGQLGRPGQVAALVGAEHGAVQHHRRTHHHPVEVGEHPAATGAREGEVLTVDPRARPALRVPVAPGQRGHGVRERDPGEAAVVVARGFGAVGPPPAEQPAPVEHVAAGGRHARPGLLGGRGASAAGRRQRGRRAAGRRQRARRGPGGQRGRAAGRTGAQNGPPGRP